MSKFTVDYKSIKGMVVELPKEFNGYKLVSAFAEAYVNHTFSGSIAISDECLIRSIGSDTAKEALLLGIEDRFKPEVASVFRSIAETQGVWEISLLVARHGYEKGRVVYFEKFSGYPKEIIDLMLNR